MKTSLQEAVDELLKPTEGACVDSTCSIALPTAGDCSFLCLVLSIKPGACFHCTLETRSPLRDPQILSSFDGLEILNVPFAVLSIDA
jgi:hypothetical protein